MMVDDSEEFIRDFLQKNPKCCSVDRHPVNRNPVLVAISPERLISYRDIKDFRALNPDCCSFDRVGFYGEVGSTGLWSKITGYSAGFTNVKFKVHYRDARNEIKTKFSAESFNLTNCGRGAWPHQS